jgi:hypothetical protein
MSPVTTADGRTVVHFHALVGDRWCVACMPHERELGQTPQHANYQMSNDPRAVNCAQCRATPAYRAEEARLRGLLRGGY